MANSQSSKETSQKQSNDHSEIANSDTRCKVEDQVLYEGKISEDGKETFEQERLELMIIKRIKIYIRGK